MIPEALSVLALLAPAHEHHHHHRPDHRVAVVRPWRSWMARTAQCESTGRWFINTGNGFYGGLQFTLSSWKAVGGRSYPHQNTKLEQMYRGVKLLHKQGKGAWPICGRH